MDAEKAFIIYASIIWLVGSFSACWVIERKGKRVQAAIRKEEVRRRKHLHDEYCTQETERLYRERKNI